MMVNHDGRTPRSSVKRALLEALLPGFMFTLVLADALGHGYWITAILMATSALLTIGFIVAALVWRYVHKP
jgi:hypothetical protein